MKKLLLIAFLAVLVACAPSTNTEDHQEMISEEKMTTEDPLTELEAKAETEEMDHSVIIDKGLIAGSVSKYYDYDKAMFDEAIADGKLVLLEFHANWCPTCQQQDRDFKTAFAQLDNPNIVGFKIHYKDDESTPEHDALLKEYQVAGQYTKVLVKDGEVLLKTRAPWTPEQTVEELTSRA